MKLGRNVDVNLDGFLEEISAILQPIEAKFKHTSSKAGRRSNRSYRGLLIEKFGIECQNNGYLVGMIS